MLSDMFLSDKAQVDSIDLKLLQDKLQSADLRFLNDQYFHSSYAQKCIKVSSLWLKLSEKKASY